MNDIVIKTDKPYTVFAEVLEQGAIDQFESAMNQPFTVRGALMPDAHQGYTLPIGAVVATDDVVLPSWVGYDIGCGMCALPTTFSPHRVRENAVKIFEALYAAIPTGFSHNSRDSEWAAEQDLARTDMLATRFERDGLRQLGSLGGGNHFIEVGEDETGLVWIIIHSGSRGIGHAVAGMLGVIPGNMRDGSFIVRGPGNAAALWSSSHGAGRVLGRKQAKQTLDLEEFREMMAGVTALVTDETLDESPYAYKDIFEVMRLQAALVDVVAHVRPIINVKG